MMKTNAVMKVIFGLLKRCSLSISRLMLLCLFAGSMHCIAQTTPPLPPYPLNCLFPGETLYVNESIYSNDGKHVLKLQEDGNLVLYSNYNNVLQQTWTSNTPNNANSLVTCLMMQGDGNLVLYNDRWDVAWASKTSGNKGAYLQIEDVGESPHFMNIYQRIVIPHQDPIWWANAIATAALSTMPGSIQYKPALYDKRLFFRTQGGDLCRIGINGTSSNDLVYYNKGGVTIRSSPCVSNDHIYVQRGDDRLCDIEINDTNVGNPHYYAGCLTASSPYVYGDFIYFLGTNQILYKIGLNNYTVDGNKFSDYKGSFCSTPFISDNWIYLRGTDQVLYRLSVDDTTANPQPSDIRFNSSPYVVNGWIYWVGMDDMLYRVNKDSFTSYNCKGYPNCKIRGTPVVVGDVIYFQGFDHKLYSVGTEDGNLTCIEAAGFINSEPCVTVDNDGTILIFFEGDNYTLSKVTIKM